MSDTPRIEHVTPVGWPILDVGWRGGSVTPVNLGGWIATGGDILAPLKDPQLFSLARIGEHDASIWWNDPDGDLAIDAMHVKMLADEQIDFRSTDIIEWQAQAGISNQEAADFFRVALSTWNSYKAGSNVPWSIGIVCRATRRDPILLQAHFRPRKAGRPRKSA